MEPRRADETAVRVRLSETRGDRCLRVRRFARHESDRLHPQAEKRPLGHRSRHSESGRYPIRKLPSAWERRICVRRTPVVPVENGIELLHSTYRSGIELLEDRRTEASASEVLSDSVSEESDPSPQPVMSRCFGWLLTHTRSRRGRQLPYVTICSERLCHEVRSAVAPLVLLV